MSLSLRARVSKAKADSLKLQKACFQIGLDSSWVVAQINSVYDSTANVIRISTRILGCSEENTTKPKLRNTRRLDYIYFLCYFYNFFTLFLFDAVISSFSLKLLL